MFRFLLLLAVVTTFCGPVTQAAEKRPNILFILVDDQSPFDLRSTTRTRSWMPRTSSGWPRRDDVRWGVPHGIVLGSGLHPSRHMIMSGRTLWHLPIAPEGKLRCPPDLPSSTIPAVFNNAGFDTMRTCKQGNSYEGANKLFTVRHDATKRGPTDETGSPWHGERVLEYLAAREAAKDTDPFLIYFGVLASP